MEEEVNLKLRITSEQKSDFLEKCQYFKLNYATRKKDEKNFNDNQFNVCMKLEKVCIASIFVAVIKQ